ncbi:hypothetical protein CRG98_026544 [Punica granatum]|uniref:Uncharacterized protein n=1 Tax=Punica granatum TaxID=22663 RepID=A0A2I0JAQ5_PUNGR|nr:hypothetical protein CRG98_026544 [Punica granatum]
MRQYLMWLIKSGRIESHKGGSYSAQPEKSYITYIKHELPALQYMMPPSPFSLNDVIMKVGDHRSPSSIADYPRSHWRLKRERGGSRRGPSPLNREITARIESPRLSKEGALLMATSSPSRSLATQEVTDDLAGAVVVRPQDPHCPSPSSCKLGDNRVFFFLF